MALTQMLLKALLLAKRALLLLLKMAEYDAAAVSNRRCVLTANDGAILLSKMVEKALLHLLKKNCSC
jgi:hypothetical protein